MREWVSKWVRSEGEAKGKKIKKNTPIVFYHNRTEEHTEKREREEQQESEREWDGEKKYMGDVREMRAKRN